MRLVNHLKVNTAAMLNPRHLLKVEQGVVVVRIRTGCIGDNTGCIDSLVFVVVKSLRCNDLQGWLLIGFVPSSLGGRWEPV